MVNNFTTETKTIKIRPEKIQFSEKSAKPNANFTRTGSDFGGSKLMSFYFGKTETFLQKKLQEKAIKSLVLPKSVPIQIRNLTPITKSQDLQNPNNTPK